MKRNFLIILAFIAASCSKTMEVDTPGLKVSIDAARLVNDTFTFKVGDTTRFLFSGDAGNISFYSGELGKRYDSRSATKKLGNVIFSFSSTAQFGTQTNTLTVLATNKLPGLDSVSVMNADWTDITSRAALATSATLVNSGNINLTDLVQNESDSLFIALKYSGVTGSTQRTWTITNWLVNNVLPERTVAVSTLADDVAFWTRYGNVYFPANGRWTPGATSLVLTGGAATAATNTNWIISKPIYVGRIPGDLATGIKSIIDPAKKEHLYMYPAAGIYKATFVAFNHTLDDEKSVIREIIIKVIP
ncbi:DUF5017 domain-containing protein [uncultured Chitinophaga sp.]|uniref:DUF5017 domain-containing protein n=1 Tax=uncultured Chitinophaga sp. TaxID=339340 RepID=UPI0025CBF979|nr:DUF5017 domain-containing protein [uncultured Chitinophaga sp.]